MKRTTNIIRIKRILVLRIPQVQIRRWIEAKSIILTTDVGFITIAIRYNYNLTGRKVLSVTEGLRWRII